MTEQFDLMKRCGMCGKFMWFFQRKGYTEDKYEKDGKGKAIIHLKCYEKQLFEDTQPRNKKAGKELIEDTHESGRVKGGSEK